MRKRGLPVPGTDATVCGLFARRTVWVNTRKQRHCQQWHALCERLDLAASVLQRDGRRTAYDVSGHDEDVRQLDSPALWPGCILAVDTSTRPANVHGESAVREERRDARLANIAEYESRAIYRQATQGIAAENLAHTSGTMPRADSPLYGIPRRNLTYRQTAEGPVQAEKFWASQDANTAKVPEVVQATLWPELPEMREPLQK